MKSIIFLAFVLAVAVCNPITAFEEDKMIKFNYNLHQDSPFGLVMEGLINPQNEDMNKIQTFLKLADQYIPVLETIGKADNELTWSRDWYINFAGVNLVVHGYFQLIVGWKVTPGGYYSDRFDVVYTPFAWGASYGRVNGTTWLAEGRTWLAFHYVDASAPISVQLYKSGKVCFQGSYSLEPVALKQHLEAGLRQCSDEILDDLIEGGSIFDWTCDMVDPVNNTIWDANFTDRITGDFLPQTCFDF